MTEPSKVVLNEEIFRVDSFLTDKECRALIESAEKDGFKPSPLSGGGHGRTGREDARTNQFTVIPDHKLADTWFKRIRPFVPDDLTFIPSSPYFGEKGGAEWKPVGLVERLRYYKYESGNEYPEHMDGSYTRKVIRNNQTYQQQSFLTLLVYLNDDFTGGTTNFFPHKQHCRFLRDIELKVPTVVVTPQKGSGLVSLHTILHEGSAVEDGLKYVVRTDIVFERLIPAHPKLEKFQEKKQDSIEPWERIFEPSCKEYHD
jgi:prolyl 4-hydroxylase